MFITVNQLRIRLCIWLLTWCQKHGSEDREMCVCVCVLAGSLAYFGGIGDSLCLFIEGDAASMRAHFYILEFRPVLQFCHKSRLLNTSTPFFFLVQFMTRCLFKRLERSVCMHQGRAATGKPQRSNSPCVALNHGQSVDLFSQ